MATTNPKHLPWENDRSAGATSPTIARLSLVDHYRPLIESRIHETLHIAKRTVKTTGRLCELLTMSLPQKRQLMMAAELHQIGFLALPEAMCDKPMSAYSAEDWSNYVRHPEVGAATLDSDGRADIAHIVRHYREDYSGTGYPHRLAMHHIPLGSRIVRIAADLAQFIREDGLCTGLGRLEAGSGLLYDSELVRLLTEGSTTMHGTVPLLSHTIDAQTLTARLF